MKILLLFLCLCSSALGTITVTPGTLGNLFLTTETVSIPVTTSGNQVTWIATDYFGAMAASGNAPPLTGKATILPGINDPGWYSLEIKEWNGASLISTRTTSFAIITPVDAAAMQDSPFGVTSHFAQFHDRNVIPLMKKAGIVQMKDEHYWAATETTTKGNYVWNQKFVLYLAVFEANSLVPMIPLTWSNPLYDYQAGVYTAPHTDEGRLGYVNFGKAIVDHYGGGNQIKSVEVWNEYNAGTFIKGPAATNKPFYYDLMLRKVWETIKPSHPDVKIVAGATVPIAHGFLKSIFAKGDLAFCDVVSVHPYCAYVDGVDLEVEEVHNLIKTANGGVDKPVWATEFSRGIVSDTDRINGASYLAQIVVLMLSQKVERMYYYLIMDDGLFPYRGLVGSGADARGAFRPHPVFIAYANLIRQFYGATYQSRYATPASIYALKFLKDGQSVNVLWSNRPVQVDLATDSTLTVTDIMGGVATQAPAGGKVRLGLTRDVQYVLGEIGSVTPIGNDLLADSVSGHSKTQGTNGWSYGWVTLGSTAAYDPASFQPMNWAIWGSDNYRWIKPGASYPFAGGVVMHPSSSWAIRRWVSSYAGRASLSGKISRAANGDGNGIRIFVDGAEVYTQHILPGQTISYGVDVVLNVGSKVDFTINQWAESSYDATEFTSQIIGKDFPASTPKTSE